MRRTIYDSGFYESQEEESERSAREVVPWIVGHIKPSSVLDVGCGVGTWLTTFIDHGVSDVLGLDGDYVDRSTLRVPPEHFRAVDLRRPLELNRTFDLAISLEVGEHLPTDAAPRLVDLLTRAAPVVLFSAAIPGQGGTNHINEQWQDVWAELFALSGYTAIDCVRPVFWHNERVTYHYAQNTILYVREGHELETQLKKWSAPLRIVHPLMLQRAKRPSLRYLLRELPNAFGRSWRRQTRRAKSRVGRVRPTV